MRFAQVKLYSVAAPMALLPVMDFALSEIPDWLRGLEFRAYLAEFISQMTAAAVDAFVLAIIQSMTGVQLG